MRLITSGMLFGTLPTLGKSSTTITSRSTESSPPHRSRQLIATDKGVFEKSPPSQ